MSGPLANALTEVARVFPGLEEVLRVDVADDGGLGLTALGAGVTRWFTYDSRGLAECSPVRDAKIPLARWLHDRRDWRVLSYRPGRRMVVLSTGEPRSVLKGHKRGRSEQAAERQRIAESAMAHGAFHVPRLLRRDDVHEALVFEFLEGHEAELDLTSVAAYARLGSQLAIFQEERTAAGLEPFGVREELAVLVRWRQKALSATGALPAGWPSAFELLERCAAALPEPRLGPCHRDLHDRQVHLSGRETALLDFDLLCLADVALDPANLIAHLRWRALQRLHGADDASVRALQAAMLGGLGRAREPGFDVRLAFYTASAWLRLALVYSLRPRWSARVPELVSLARASLDESVATR